MGKLYLSLFIYLFAKRNRFQGKFICIVLHSTIVVDSIEPTQVLGQVNGSQWDEVEFDSDSISLKKNEEKGLVW